MSTASTTFFDQLDVRDLQVLIDVAEVGRLRRAGVRSGIAQSLKSRRIRRLEDCRLFDNLGHFGGEADGAFRPLFSDHATCA